jgi:hypothetical protein
MQKTEAFLSENFGAMAAGAVDRMLGENDALVQTQCMTGI